MKSIYYIPLLLFKIYAIELIQNIGNQEIGKGLFFSMRIDDKFDEVIVNASVKSPGFLNIGKQEIELRKIAQVYLLGSGDFKAMVSFNGKFFFFKGSEIDIYTISSTLKVTLEQRYFDRELRNYRKIEVCGEVLIVFQELEVLVFTLKEEKFLEKVGKIRVEETILFGKVVNGRVLLVSQNGIQVYQLIDTEIGYFELEDSINITQTLKKNLYLNDLYMSPDRLYLLDNQLGVLEFEFFPLKHTKTLPYFGSRLSGYLQDLCIDGRIIINTNTSALLYYPISLACSFLRIDSDFIYCGSPNTILVMSRQVSVQELRDLGPLYGIEAFQGILCLVSQRKILLVSPQLSPLNIEGTTPGSVGKHKVVFEVESISGHLTHQFVLTVQYNFSDLIILILFSVISIFFLTFICSCGLKFINKTPQEPLEIGRVSTDPQASSSDRNILSEANLIGK